METEIRGTPTPPDHLTHVPLPVTPHTGDTRDTVPSGTLPVPEGPIPDSSTSEIPSAEAVTEPIPSTRTSYPRRKRRPPDRYISSFH